MVPPERKPEDGAAHSGDTQLRAAAHHDHTVAEGPEERTPQTRRQTRPTGEVASHRLTKTRRNPNGRGSRRRARGQKTRRGGRDHQRSRTRPKTTPPPQPEKETTKKGGAKPRPQRPPHNPTPQAAPPRSGGKRTRRAQEGTCPITPTRQAGWRKHPNPHTHTTNPSQECRSAAKSRIQARKPWTPAKNGGVTAEPNPKRAHHEPQPVRAGQS